MFRCSKQPKGFFTTWTSKTCLIISKLFINHKLKALATTLNPNKLCLIRKWDRLSFMINQIHNKLYIVIATAPTKCFFLLWMKLLIIFLVNCHVEIREQISIESSQRPSSSLQRVCFVGTKQKPSRYS